MLVLHPALMRSPRFASTASTTASWIRSAAFVNRRGLSRRTLPIPANHLTLTYMAYLFLFLVSICLSKFALGYPAGLVDLIQFGGLSRPLVIFLVFMLLINSLRRVWLLVNTIIISGAAVIYFGFAQISGQPWARLLTMVLYNRKNDLPDWLLLSRHGTFEGR
jgi:hypothetical protein